MITMTDNTLLTLEEVAQRLRVSQRTVKRFIMQGRIEGILVGTRYRVRQEALARYLARNTRPDTNNT